MTIPPTTKRPPLHGLLVVDLSQFLAGPYAALRLQDLGARVIKVERPVRGDLCRELYLSDTVINGESTLFHAINRGKESIALNLKSDADRAVLTALVRRADVVLQNFRPGVIERLGFGPDHVFAINPQVIYGSVSGYGADGDWRHLPGQDLLAQARSGVMWLNGAADDGPVPVGLPVADMMAGANLAQGVLAALVRRGVSGEGALVETSLMESMLDFQFEVLATHLNNGGRLPVRSTCHAAHSGLAAPYGVYPTRDGHLAIAMVPLGKLGSLLGLPLTVDDPQHAFTQRDRIKRVIAERLVTQDTRHWQCLLETEDIWCAPVMNWHEVLRSQAVKQLDMLHTVSDGAEGDITLTRLPIRINGHRPRSHKPAPKLDADRQAILCEFLPDDDQGSDFR